MSDLFSANSAIISPCGLYRYRLERDGPGVGQTAVIMVNPSTADAEQDDATIRKLRGFGRRYQWGRILVGNLFAYRATDVRELGWIADADPIGPDNDRLLAMAALEADRVIFAWGPVSKVPRRLRDRWRVVDRLFRDKGHVPMSIGVPALCGHPKHPLMLPYSLTLQPWSAPS